MYFLLGLISCVLAGVRMAGVRHIGFQAAHLFVGGLAGARIAGGPKFLTWLAVLLSALEPACFLFLPR